MYYHTISGHQHKIAHHVLEQKMLECSRFSNNCTKSKDSSKDIINRILFLVSLAMPMLLPCNIMPDPVELVMLMLLLVH